MTDTLATPRAKALLDWFIRNEDLCPSADPQDLCLSDPDRATRLWDAAEVGCDGSTHAEVIADWRRNAENAFRWDRRLPNVLDAIELAILDVEAWHEANGSLDDEVG